MPKMFFTVRYSSNAFANKWYFLVQISKVLELHNCKNYISSNLISVTPIRQRFFQTAICQFLLNEFRHGENNITAWVVIRKKVEKILEYIVQSAALISLLRTAKLVKYKWIVCPDEKFFSFIYTYLPIIITSQLAIDNAVKMIKMLKIINDNIWTKWFKCEKNDIISVIIIIIIHYHLPPIKYIYTSKALNLLLTYLFYHFYSYCISLKWKYHSIVMF